MKRSDENWILIGIFVFGVCALGGVNQWLDQGSIGVRRVSRGGGVVQPKASGDVSGEITRNHFLYYPMCAAWGVLAASMVILSTLTFFWRNSILMRLTVYTAPAIIFLGFLTVVLSMLVKPS